MGQEGARCCSISDLIAFPLSIMHVVISSHASESWHGIILTAAPGCRKAPRYDLAGQQQNRQRAKTAKGATNRGLAPPQEQVHYALT